MKLLSLALAIWLAPLFTSAQKELQLHLSYHHGNGPFEYGLPMIKWDKVLKDSSEFKNMPTHLKNIRTGRIFFDISQYYFQSYKTGKISPQHFDSLQNFSGIKFYEKELTPDWIKCYVNILTGVNDRLENVVIIDANNNQDFSDEQPFIPLFDTLSDNALNKQLVEVKCQRKIKGMIVEETVPLLVTQNVQVMAYAIAQYATAILQDGSKKYKLAVCPWYFITKSYRKIQVASMPGESTKKVPEELVFTDGDFIKIGPRIYRIIGVDYPSNTLRLETASLANQHSSQVGYHAPLFEESDIVNGYKISLSSFKGKYVLLDFWGTWCSPCRDQLPDLVKLNTVADTSRFTMISIATNDKQDALKKVIADQKMTWPQLLSDKIANRYRITAFPTTILVDPNGVVIAKDLPVADWVNKLAALGLLKAKPS